MDDQNLPQHDTSDPYDQFYADNPEPAQPAEPRQAPDHIAMNSQTLQSQSPAKGPTPAFRPGETAPAQPVHNNIPQQEEPIYSDDVVDPQALINQAITDQSEEIGEELPTFEN
ncbi:hypothetical protein KC573_01860, partial [candidate division WWE3 bacterium]|nr:hypothetical protein [candidate division WWE3 bacterium]